ncbi:MAG: hypothetical protein NWE92_01715 [Candidatus Bathyarchaeota archaeon]|nr:hypothetical protein [Candidatus Bathyarchaeota archaeon]
MENKLAELVEYHKQTQNFRKWALKQSEAVTKLSSDLRTTVVTIIEGKIEASTESQQEATKASESKEKETTSVNKQLERLPSILQSLHDLSNNLNTYAWKEHIKKIRQFNLLDVQLPFSNQIDNQSFLSAFSILDCEKQIANKCIDSARLLKQSLSLFKKLDLSISFLSADLSNQRLTPRFLAAATNIVKNAEENALCATELINSNESLWNELINLTRPPVSTEGVLAVDADKTRAAIYVYPNPQANPAISIQDQINACQRFIERKQWITADLFVEDKEDESMIPLICEKAQSGAFDYVVSFVNCTPTNFTGGLNGVVFCLEAEFYYKTYPLKISNSTINNLELFFQLIGRLKT